MNWEDLLILFFFSLGFLQHFNCFPFSWIILCESLINRLAFFLIQPLLRIDYLPFHLLSLLILLSVHNDLLLAVLLLWLLLLLFLLRRLGVQPIEHFSFLFFCTNQGCHRRAWVQSLISISSTFRTDLRNWRAVSMVLLAWRSISVNRNLYLFELLLNWLLLLRLLLSSSLGRHHSLHVLGIEKVVKLISDVWVVDALVSCVFGLVLPDLHLVRVSSLLLVWLHFDVYQVLIGMVLQLRRVVGFLSLSFLFFAFAERSFSVCTLFFVEGVLDTLLNIFLHNISLVLLLVIAGLLCLGLLLILKVILTLQAWGNDLCLSLSGSLIGLLRCLCFQLLIRNVLLLLLLLLRRNEGLWGFLTKHCLGCGRSLLEQRELRCVFGA